MSGAIQSWIDERRRHVISAESVTRFRDATDDVEPAKPEIIPASFLLAVGWNAPFERVPGANEHGATWLNAGDRFEYETPIYVGSELESRTELRDVFDKQGASGLLRFYKFLTVYTDVSGHEVARHVGTRIRK